ncbi:hypothetical protein ACP70R_031628 [Stipagrostis hirtigluma subsp. patula]
MKTGKNRRTQQQQQRGRPVLVTFYVARPKRDGGEAATASAHDAWNHHHHRNHRLHLHGGGRGERRWSSSKPKVDSRPYNRREELLEYSRQLRELARRTAAATTAVPSPRPPPPWRRRHDAETVRHHGIHVCTSRPPQVGPAVRGGDEQQAAGDDDSRLSLARRPQLEHATSQRQVRQRCFGGWSWKRVLVLVFPFPSGESKRSRRSRREGQVDRRGNNGKSNRKGWPAASLVGKLTVSKNQGDHGGLVEKLMSIFRQRSR